MLSFYIQYTMQLHLQSMYCSLMQYAYKWTILLENHCTLYFDPCHHSGCILKWLHQYWKHLTMLSCALCQALWVKRAWEACLPFFQNVNRCSPCVLSHYFLPTLCHSLFWSCLSTPPPPLSRSRWLPLPEPGSAGSFLLLKGSFFSSQCCQVLAHRNLPDLIVGGFSPILSLVLLAYHISTLCT